MELDAPADPKAVEGLNRAPFPPAALDPSSRVVAAGNADAAFVERIRREHAERWGPDFPATLEASGTPVVYAALRKSLSFEHAFRPSAAPLRFAGGRKRVASFGLPAFASGPEAERIAAQAAVYFDEKEDAHRADRPPFVLELTPKGGADRILLASIPPAPTLEDAWLAAERLTVARNRHAFDAGGTLEVPRVDVRAPAYRFRELAPAGIRGTSARLVDVVQDLRFRLDERGALLEARVLATAGMHFPVVLDGPFLLALEQRGADRPYLLLWVGNDDLLEAFVDDPPAGAELARLMGAWATDVEASKARVSAKLRPDQPEHAWLLRNVATEPLALEVTAKGTARFAFGRGRSREGRLRMRAQGLVIVAPTGDLEERETSIAVRWEDGRLVVGEHVLARR